MTNLAHMGNTEILQIADAVAREKGIEKDLVIEAMGNSIEIAARKKYGYDRNISAEINKKTGEISLFRILEVVADDIPNKSDVENEEEGFDDAKQIKLADAFHKKEDAKVGDILKEPLPPIDLGRVAAQTAKQIITQKVREAVKDQQYDDFKDRVGEIVNGVVKRVEYGNTIVEIGRAEAIIRRDESIRGENYRINDRVRAYIKDVKKDPKSQQIILSRTAPEFMAKLFAQEVPEVYDNIIEIKSVAREPGSRAKIAVFSNDSNIDPVGSCVGVRGSRVQAVINELQGEKIDIIQWDNDPATFIVNALVPAEVAKVVIDEENNRLEVVVPDDQLNLAIGRRGQNVRLASELSGWKIDIMTEDDESNRRTSEFNATTELLINALNVEEVIAQLLAAEGFTSVDEIAYVEKSDLESIEGFDADISEALQERARDYLKEHKENFENKVKELNIDQKLIDIDGLSNDLVLTLAEKDIKTIDNFADLSTDEFIELIPDSGLSDSEISDLIMLARSHWFEDEKENKE